MRNMDTIKKLKKYANIGNDEISEYALQLLYITEDKSYLMSEALESALMQEISDMLHCYERDFMIVNKTQRITQKWQELVPKEED